MKLLDNYPDISFIEEMSLADMQRHMLQDFQERYQEITGEELKLPKADPARLILYAAALQLYQEMQYLDKAGKMGLLKYSMGGFLDNLGALKGIVRNNGEKSTTLFRFTLSAARNEAVIIPAGTRMTAGDNVFFYTREEGIIQKGELRTEIEGVCAEAGTIGNGYEIGEIKILVDPIPYMKEVMNIEPTSGGAEREDDENLSERIFLAPSSYSVAGPDGAYKYWVKTYNPSIKDVMVHSPTPGVVDIRFVLDDGNLPDQAMIDGVTAFLRDGEKRPLTDHVQVAAPELRPYQVRLKYWINRSDNNKASAIQKTVEEAVVGFDHWQRAQIGRDINASMLIHMVMAAGAKRVEIEEPEFKSVAATELAVMETAEVLYEGIEDD